MLTKNEKEKLRIVTRLFHNCDLKSLMAIEKALIKKQPKNKK